MTEEEARDWVADRFTPEQRARLDRFAAMVADENGRQNLVSPTTLQTIWARHMVDSLQLVDFAPADGAWMDIGTGGGFPGLVVGIVRDTAVHLVEPRRRRAEFLSAAADELGLPHVAVHASKVESVDERAKVISARAVASVEALVEAARHVASRDTIWLLPRGRIGSDETAGYAKLARVFHVEQSITDPDSKIAVLRGVLGR